MAAPSAHYIKIPRPASKTDAGGLSSSSGCMTAYGLLAGTVTVAKKNGHLWLDHMKLSEFREALFFPPHGEYLDFTGAETYPPAPGDREIFFSGILP